MDTAPGPAPMCRAPKNYPISSDLRISTQTRTAPHEQCPMLPEVWVRRTVRPSGNTTLSQRAAPVGSRLSPHRLHPRNLLDLHNQDVEHLVNGLQLRNLSGLLNWTKGNGLSATTGKTTTMLIRLQLRNLHIRLYHEKACHEPCPRTAPVKKKRREYLSLCHNWNVQHSVEELNQRDQEHEGLLELVEHAHRDVLHVLFLSSVLEGGEVVLGPCANELPKQPSNRRSRTTTTSSSSFTSASSSSAQPTETEGGGVGPWRRRDRRAPPPEPRRAEEPRHRP